MARKYDKDINVEIELIRNNLMAKDLFEQVSKVVVAYSGDTMMIASDLVCGKACNTRMQPAYEMAETLITAFGRCTFAGFLQVVEAWGRSRHGSDPKEALYFGEELLQWAVQIPVEFGSDPGDLTRENPMDRGEFLEHLGDDVWAGTPINTLWDIPEIPVCERSAVTQPFGARWLPAHVQEPIAHESTYEGDFDKDLEWLKDHQYYKDFRLAVVKHGTLLEERDGKLLSIKRNLVNAEYCRAIKVTVEAYKRRIFK